MSSKSSKGLRSYDKSLNLLNLLNFSNYINAAKTIPMFRRALPSMTVFAS